MYSIRRTWLGNPSRASGLRLGARAFVGILAALGTSLATPPIASAAESPAAGHQVVVSRAPSDSAVPGNYIVTLRSGVDPGNVTRSNKISEKHRFRSAVNGFSAVLSNGQLESLQRNSDVVAIEEVQRVNLAGTQNPTPNWGLDRINQRDLPMDNQYSWDSAGSGAKVYVIDTGIDSDHVEFEGRAWNVFDALGGNGEDCYGHGTHVAGIIGGKNVGVAKSVSLRGLRVSDCAGKIETPSVVAALDWVRENAQKPAVVNMSLGSPAPSAVVDQATASVIAAGIPVVASAGNEGQDACNNSPARVAKVITVGATNRYDMRENYSNFGPCVDIHAPGHQIVSAELVLGGYASHMGTSMAAPHVSGAAARYLGLHPDWSVGDVSFQLLVSASEPNIGNLPQGTSKKLLYIEPKSTHLDTDVAYGYLKAYDASAPLNQPVTPINELQRNSAGKVNTVTRTATGTYAVDFPGLEGFGGTAHAMAVDTKGGQCKIESWSSEVAKQRVIIKCRDALGVPKNLVFYVMYMRALKALTGNFGYVWAGQKSSPAYTPDSTWSYNSKGNVNTVSRLSAGRYSVSFPGLAQAQGNVMVTAQGDDSIYCKVRNWTPVGQAEVVYVNCYTAGGNPADSKFDVTFTDTRSITGTTGARAHGWVPGLQATFMPPAPPYTLTWAFNSESAVPHLSVEHKHVGYYVVKIPLVLGSLEGAILAVAQGDSQHSCSAIPTGGFGLGKSVTVTCSDAAGNDADSAFNLHYVG